MTEQKYNQKEEFVNYITHLFGVFLSIYGTVILVANSKNTAQFVTTTVFGASLFLLFISSSLYHRATSINIKNFFQKIDHAAIYVFIAGTYTPSILFTVESPLSFILLAIIWALAILGITLTCIKLKSKYLSTGLYLLMGWISLMLIGYVWSASHLAVWLLFAGGVLYSIGSLFYLMKPRYMHSIWHLFVLSGAVLHYFAIFELLKTVNI